MVADNRLDKYGEWALIDSIAMQYSYTHDEVFALSWGEAMTIIAYNRERAYINHATDNMYKEANKKN